MTPTTPVEAKYTKFSCPNPGCSLFNQPGQGNIVHRSWTGRDKGIERLRCSLCQKEFSEREGTLMARGKLPEEKVIRLTKCQRWGVCDEGTADICEVDIKTVHRFQGGSSGRAQEHQQQVACELEVEGVQVDEAHSKRRPGKVEWIHTALAMGSLFILFVTFGPRNTDTAAYLIAQVVARLKAVPLFLTDGWNAYPAALLRVLGKVYRPRRKGKVGRFPKPRVVAPPNLFYAQVIKVRDQAGRTVEVKRKVVFGGPRRFFKQLFQKGLGTTIQTAFMERWYASLRGWVAALRRRTRCLSWSSQRHQGRVWLMVSLYNFVIPHKSLRQGKTKRTPAMAIGLTDHIWSYREYIWLPVHPDPTLKKKMDERIERLLTPALPDALKADTPAKTRPKRTGRKRAGPLKRAA
jgi:IS1 family transposase